METEINKTIVVSYDEITRMLEFCTNKGEGVTREFMDWYVNENAFFSKTGMLICEKVLKYTKVKVFLDTLESADDSDPDAIEQIASEKKFVISFNFNNPNIPSFVMYDYAKQKPVCRYIMIRENNLAMKDVTIKISWIDLNFFKQPDSTFMSDEVYKEVKNEYDNYKISEKDKNKIKGLNRMQYLKAEAKILERELERVNLKIATFMAVQGVYFCYATMYYFAKNKAKEVTGMTKDGSVEFITGRQVKTLYKYTGYVNINEAKVYTPVIKKDGPIREYGRHIEKWSVRGHYRKVGDKTIWIEPFEKGEGELEKRIYGTEKESEVNVIPKVFEVNRNVKVDLENQQIIVEPFPKLPPITFIISPRTKQEQIELYGPGKSKIGFWQKIFSFFNKLKFK